MAAPESENKSLVDFLIDLPVRGLFGLLALLPYRQSLATADWITSRILAPPFGVNRRIRENLKRVWPEMPETDIRRLCLEVSGNSARLMVESFLTRGFLRNTETTVMTGPGKKLLMNSLRAGRPTILVSGHFGNYQVVRVLLARAGYASAGVYRPMNNGFTNERYIRNMNRIATPNFSRGMRGTKNLLGHLRKGGVIALLNDQAANEGHDLSFMGHPAKTMTSAAGFALKYDALLFPAYGVRLQSGVDFEVRIEKPVTPSDAKTMTQDLNDSLDAIVRKHPGQWFWVHRRWKDFS